jgi:hypothetical protein
MLRHAFADEARFVNLGRRGNRVELVHDLPHADARAELSEDELGRAPRPRQRPPTPRSNCG